MMLLDQNQLPLPITSYRNHRQIRFTFKDESQGISEASMVIGNGYADQKKE